MYVVSTICSWQNAQTTCGDNLLFVLPAGGWWRRRAVGAGAGAGAQPAAEQGGAAAAGEVDAWGEGTVCSHTRSLSLILIHSDLHVYQNFATVFYTNLLIMHIMCILVHVYVTCFVFTDDFCWLGISPGGEHGRHVWRSAQQDVNYRAVRQTKPDW